MISGRSRAADRNGQRFDDALVSLVAMGVVGICEPLLHHHASLPCGGVVCVEEEEEERIPLRYPMLSMVQCYTGGKVVAIVMLCPCLHAMSMVMAMMI